MPSSSNALFATSWSDFVLRPEERPDAVPRDISRVQRTGCPAPRIAGPALYQTTRMGYCEISGSGVTIARP